MKAFKMILFVFTVLVGILVYASADVSTTQPSKVSKSVPEDAIARSPGTTRSKPYNPTAEILNSKAIQDQIDRQGLNWLDLPGNVKTKVDTRFSFIKRHMNDLSFINALENSSYVRRNNLVKLNLYKGIFQVIGDINELFGLPERYNDSQYKAFVHNDNLTKDLGYVPKDALSHLSYVRHMANHQAKKYFDNVTTPIFVDVELTYIAKGMIDLIAVFDKFVNSLWSQTYNKTVVNNLVPYFGLKISGDSFAKVLEDMRTTAPKQLQSGQAETRNKRAIEASQQYDKIGAGYTKIIDEQTHSSKGVHERAADENEFTDIQNRHTYRSKNRSYFEKQ